ncbi:MAG: hypothetical protein IKK33_01610 [Lachnospiraceae bacterium]|nr:hypothetical protein [Lachnospiraceae bacterium]
MKEFAEKVKQIEMPAEMQERIKKHCYEKMEEENMKKSRKNIFQKPMVAVAALVLCLFVTGVSALAATGKLEGFFKDITRWDGAVIGTTYEQATDEVEIEITEVADRLEVNITFVDAQKVPYSTFESLGINNYQIMDKNGKALVKEAETAASTINNGQVQLSVSLEGIPAGEYNLVVTELVGSSKADQPLIVNGTWECIFVKSE